MPDAPDLAPSPALAPDRFEHRFEVNPADIDANGHANNVAYVRWIQDAAVAHWFAVVGPDAARSMSWAVVRHEVDYRRPALPGDRLVAETWIGTVTAATCERFCQIRREADGVVLAESRTVWCGFDPATGRPRRIDRALLARLRGGRPPLPDAPGSLACDPVRSPDLDPPQHPPRSRRRP